MSGWRSGSHDLGALDSAIADPAPLLGPEPRRRIQTRATLVVAAVALAVFAAHAAYEASLRPAHRALPVPINTSVLLVPVGQVPDGLLDGLSDAYQAVYGVSLTIAQPFELDPALVGSDGRTVSAEAIARAVLLDHRDSSRVVAVKRDPIATTGVDADGDMAQRFYGRVAVISTWSMPSLKMISRSTLFRKVLTRQLGFLVWRLAPTDDRYDLLYRSVENEFDVERVSDHL